MINLEQTNGQQMLDDGWSFHRVYQRGLAPPNYPMPAIQTEVSIFSDFVDVQVYERLPKWDRSFWHPVKEWHKS